MNDRERQRLLRLSIIERENELKELYEEISEAVREFRSETGMCWHEPNRDSEGNPFYPNLYKLAAKKRCFDEILRLWILESFEYLNMEWKEDAQISSAFGIENKQENSNE